MIRLISNENNRYLQKSTLLHRRDSVSQKPENHWAVSGEDRALFKTLLSTHIQTSSRLPRWLFEWGSVMSFSTFFHLCSRPFTDHLASEEEASFLLQVAVWGARGPVSHVLVIKDGLIRTWKLPRVWMRVASRYETTQQSHPVIKLWYNMYAALLRGSLCVRSCCVFGWF